VNCVFSHSKLRKQPFLAEIFKIQHPLPTTMPWSYVSAQFPNFKLVMSRHRKDSAGPQNHGALGHGLCVNPSLHQCAYVLNLVLICVWNVAILKRLQCCSEVKQCLILVACSQSVTVLSFWVLAALWKTQPISLLPFCGKFGSFLLICLKLSTKAFIMNRYCEFYCLVTAVK